MIDVRKETCIIIRKNGEYLVGKKYCSDELRWSIYTSDAVRIRDEETARRLARITGGICMLFNPIVRQMKVL